MDYFTKRSNLSKAICVIVGVIGFVSSSDISWASDDLRDQGVVSLRTHRKVVVDPELFEAIDMEKAQQFFNTVQPALKSVYDIEKKAWRAGDSTLLTLAIKLFGEATKYLSAMQTRVFGLQNCVKELEQENKDLNGENIELRRLVEKEKSLPKVAVEQPDAGAELQRVQQNYGVLANDLAEEKKKTAALQLEVQQLQQLNLQYQGLPVQRLSLWALICYWWKGPGKYLPIHSDNNI